MLNDNVSILFCSYNGEGYIREQLDSILAQTHKNWILYISDDGSTDSTLNIIQDYHNKLPENKLILLKGPGRGFAANFLSLMKRSDIQSTYFAFSDQDDIWLKTKLERAIDAIRRVENQKASQYVLYGGRTILINEEKKIIGQSPFFKREFKLENALLQSYAGGNTMLFNNALKKKIETFPDDIPIVSHDWFLYLICSVFSGVNIYDPHPQILYRQHAGNIVGSNIGLKSKIDRLKRLYLGQFIEWNRINKKNIDFFYPEISYNQRLTIDRFYSCASCNIVTRIKGLHSAKVYRQAEVETFLFFIMNLFKRLI